MNASNSVILSFGEAFLNHIGTSMTGPAKMSVQIDIKGIRKPA